MGYFYAISSLAGRFSVAYSYDGGLCGGAQSINSVKLKAFGPAFLEKAISIAIAKLWQGLGAAPSSQTKVGRFRPIIADKRAVYADTCPPFK